MDTMTNHYIIAILHKDHSITPLWVGRMYGRLATMLRVEHLTETCEAALKALDGERFVPYSLQQAQ